MTPELTTIKYKWGRAAAVGVVALALVGMGEAYPFTPFPMYSKLEPEADVLYIADQSGRALPISAIFGVGSAQAKKRFEKELDRQSGKRDWELVPEAVRRAAGEKFLADLWAVRRPGKPELAGISRLEARLITVRVAAKGGFDTPEQTLAMLTVDPAQP